MTALERKLDRPLLAVQRSPRTSASLERDRQQRGRSCTVAFLKAASRFQFCSHGRYVSSNDRCHRVLIVATNSANGRLQSTPVCWQENRDRRGWVDRGPSPFLHWGPRL